MKKTWIKVKRGILEARHRTRLDVRVFLYMYMVDRVDWDTGIVYGWKDKEEAVDLDMPITTLRKQRRRLEEDGYITCEQAQYGQEITINNWTDPRLYGHPKEVQGDRQGDRQGIKPVVTPTSTSHNTYHIPDELDDARFEVVWYEWNQYRIERRKKLVKSTAERQLKKLAKLGVDEAIKVIDRSITNGWTGLFPDKKKQPPAKSKIQVIKTEKGEIYI